MRKLSPDPRTGIITERNQVINTSVRAQVLGKPTESLNNIDRIISGAPPRINVIRSQGGLGDVLMTLPTVKAISKKYNTTIDYTTDFEYLDGALPAVLQHVPYINKIINFKNKMQDYDATIDLTCPCLIHEQPGAPPINRIDLFARHAQVTLTDTQIDYIVTKTEREEAFRLLEEKIQSPRNNYKLVIVQPSSSTTRRDLPLSKQKNIIQKIAHSRSDVRFLVLTHSSDSTAARDAGWNYIPDTLEIRDLQVRQIAALISLSDLSICQDSAILHIAGALSKPSFSFFGPTDPRARVNYYKNAVAICGGHDLKCFPSWYSPCKCNYLCWARTDERVCVETINSILNKQPIPAYPELIHFDNHQSTTYEIL